MYSLFKHNTFGLDVQCKDYKEYHTEEELSALLPLLANTKWLHIGGGSNLLFAGDYDGLILHSAITDCREVQRDEHNVWIRVGAGYVWDDFVAYCVEHAYYGIENLSLIPGEVGASAVQNIGAYGMEVGDEIESVEAVDVETGKKVVFHNADCHYGYRSSVFKKEWKGKYIVTYVVYRLSLTFTPHTEYGAICRMLEEHGLSIDKVDAALMRRLIIETRRAKLPDPAEIGSAGSFFMNPIVSNEKAEELRKLYPTIPSYPTDNGVKIPAGWMIEQCGWKGKSLGRAGVYAKQALVLVNLGGATGKEIIELSNVIRRDVFAKFGIEIYPEVNFIE